MTNLYNPSQNKIAVQRLTALWALAESGLGGIMFALKIPLTGFFVGGFAVIIISLIAWFSNRNCKDIIQATILVIMVKALVSPHSPPPAYFAVAFQGLAGALIFRAVKSHRLACILLGAIAMVESSLQKIIVLTIIFGKGLWEAINGLFTSISKDFAMNVHMSYAAIVIVLYAFLHALWGTLIGTWAAKIPAQIDANREKILVAFKVVSAVEKMESPKNKKSKRIKRILFFLVILAFIILIYLWTGAGTKQILWVFLRSIAVILLLFFVLQPILKYLINRWLTNQSDERKREAGDLIEMLPKLRTYVNPAYRLAVVAGSPFKKLKRFILYIIILAMYGE